LERVDSERAGLSQALVQEVVQQVLEAEMEETLQAGFSDAERCS
jgi:hypothetical protein